MSVSAGGSASIPLGLHGLLHLLHHPQGDGEGLQLVHPHVGTLPGPAQRQHQPLPRQPPAHQHLVSPVLIAAGQILDVVLDQQVGLDTDTH